MYWEVIAAGFATGIFIDMVAWGFRFIPMFLSTSLGR